MYTSQWIGRQFASLLVVLVVGIWSAPASASVCTMGGLVSKIATVPAAFAAGTPAYFAPEGSIAVAGGPSSARGPYRSGRGLAVDLSGTVEGSWGKWGMRTDWYSIERGGLCSPWWTTHGSVAATYRVVNWSRAELEGSVGVGYGFYLGPSLDLGLEYETRVGESFELEGRLRYLPHLLSSYDGSELVHVVRTRLRLKWLVSSGFQPFAGAAAGRSGAGSSSRNGEPSVLDGLYATGLVGVEFGWSR